MQTRNSTFLDAFDLRFRQNETGTINSRSQQKKTKEASIGIGLKFRFQTRDAAAPPRKFRTEPPFRLCDARAPDRGSYLERDPVASPNGGSLQKIAEAKIAERFPARAAFRFGHAGIPLKRRARATAFLSHRTRSPNSCGQGTRKRTNRISKIPRTNRSSVRSSEQKKPPAQGAGGGSQKAF